MNRRELFVGLAATWAASKRKAFARPEALSPPAPAGSLVQEYIESDAVDGRNFLLVAAETAHDQRKLHRSIGVRYYARVGTGRTLFYFSSKVREAGIINFFVTACAKHEHHLCFVSQTTKDLIEIRTVDQHGMPVDSDFYVMMNGIIRAGLADANGMT